MHSLGYFLMIYQNKQIAYRQMSLFVTPDLLAAKHYPGGRVFIYIAVLLERAAKMS
jgi:hypothetical protein